MADFEVFDCEQGTPEWFAARAGIPTASQFSTVLASGKGGGESLTRRKYLYQLAGEAITRTVADSFSNAHMERGKTMEADARRLYAFQADAEPRSVGFVRRGRAGASPDSLIDADGLLEIKTKLPHLQIECLLDNRVPSEHIAQIQGQMWVTGRDWCDFVSYWPGLPLFVKRVARDAAYIANLETQVARFNDELDAIVARVKDL